MPILASTSVSPGDVAAEAARWETMSLRWTGADGSVWDLADYSGGAVLAQGGLRGLGMPTMTRYSTAGPVVPGSRWRGMRIEDRDVLWNVFVGSDGGSADWLIKDRAWWAGLRPDVAGTWRVTLPTGSYRELTCRLVDDGDWGPEVDPVMSGWALYQVSLVADDDPLWRGAPIDQTYTAGSSTNWLSPGGGGVIGISPSQTIGSATLTNPGDVEAWARWSITGPCDSAVLGVAGGTVTYTSPIASGRTVTIDTSPRVLTARDDTGVDVSGLVTWSALPIPPGANVPLTVTLASLGAGAQVGVRIVPGYYRAW